MKSTSELITVLEYLKQQARNNGIHYNWTTNGSFINDSSGMHMIAQFGGALGPGAIVDVFNAIDDLLLKLKRLQKLESGDE